MKKIQLLQKCKKMLNGELELNVTWLIENIFINHPNFNKKVEGGLKDIIIKKNKYNEKGFYILKNDNSITDISFYKSISYPSKKTEISKGLRNIIKKDIYEYRKQVFLKEKVYCEICHKRIFNNLNCHIDHKHPTFNNIVNYFLKDKNIDDLFNLLKGFENNSEEKYFSDEKIISDFYILHKNIAKLQVLCSKCNLSKKKENENKTNN